MNGLLLFSALVTSAAPQKELVLKPQATTADLLTALGERAGWKDDGKIQCYVVFGTPDPDLASVTVRMGKTRQSVSYSCDWSALAFLLDGRAVFDELMLTGGLVLGGGFAPSKAPPSVILQFGKRGAAFVRRSLAGTGTGGPATGLLKDLAPKKDWLPVLMLGGGATELPTVNPDAGTADAQEILKRVIKAFETNASLKTCVRAADGGVDEAPGAITLDVLIAADGRVTDVWNAVSTLRDEAADTCVIEQVRKMKFGASPAGQPELISIPVFF